MESNFLEFRCVGIENGGKIPIENTGRGQDISPEFVIENLSPKAKTLAVTLEDLSHPIKNFTHWTCWNIKASDTIPENVGSKKDIMQGIAYGFHKYAGPKPPKFQTHRYRFLIYSLDTMLNISPDIMKKKLIKAMNGHILQAGMTVGSFKR